MSTRPIVFFIPKETPETHRVKTIREFSSPTVRESLELFRRNGYEKILHKAAEKHIKDKEGPARDMSGRG